MVLKRRAAALVGLGALAVLVWAGASLGAPSDTFRSGVESVISEPEVRELIPRLIKQGAAGIIEYPLNKIV